MGVDTNIVISKNIVQKIEIGASYEYEIGNHTIVIKEEYKVIKL